MKSKRTPESVTFHTLYTWERVENGHIAASVKIAKESVSLHGGCGKDVNENQSF